MLFRSAPGRVARSTGPVDRLAQITRLGRARRLQLRLAMNEDEEDVVLLDRPVVYLEPDELHDDELGFEDETAEYVLARVEEDFDDVVIEEIELCDIEELEQRRTRRGLSDRVP